MSALTVGADEFVTLEIGSFRVKDPDHVVDQGGLDTAELDEVSLDEQ